MKIVIVLHSLVVLALVAVRAAEPAASPGDEMVARYFETETRRLAGQCLAEIKTLDDWTAKKGQYREQLFEMLSLSPLPNRTDLKPVVTGRIDHELFSVENLHFQSMPGLYVTGNLYLPKNTAAPAPAILYVCGHAHVIIDGVKYGNKTAYQHHGEWFARNGYVCLTIDTVQLGEIEGIHHGTYREGMWWWNARGYSSAGVEAWNSIRALDYLESRPEVDPTRFGVTGRSGGGAYSWWLAALDDRVKAAAPVAGITDLENHVIDGTVEGHCDCMFTVNTYRWDYPQVAALVAPRPLLICNSDKDSIFPLDGVVRVHSQVRRIYELHGARDKLGLLITEGPHRDTQDLQLPVFRWFNRHLKGEDPVIEMAATKFLEPQPLKVFPTLPEDERTSTIHETFVPKPAEPAPPQSADEWSAQRERWMGGLKEKVFLGWPAEPRPIELKALASEETEDLRLDIYEFTSQHNFGLRLFVVRGAKAKSPEQVLLHVLDDETWAENSGLLAATFKTSAAHLQTGTSGPAEATALKERFVSAVTSLSRSGQAVAYLAPRGIGPTSWTGNERKRIQIRRRFMLLGQTLDGMRVWDIRRGIQSLRATEGLANSRLSLRGRGVMGINALYAALFEPSVAALFLDGIPASHRTGPDYLNVLRILDIPQAAAIAAERVRLDISSTEAQGWEYPEKVAAALNWPAERLHIRRQ